MDHFFTATSIIEEGKQKAVFLTVIGASLYTKSFTSVYIYTSAPKEWKRTKVVTCKSCITLTNSPKLSLLR